MHILVDLETLSTRINCVITQIGWCAFDPASEGVMWHESRRPEIDDQLRRLKRVMDYDTISWWLKQAEDARKGMYESIPDCSLEEFLSSFAHQYNWKDVEGVWSHGLGFDVVILENAYREARMPVPWNYKTPRDTRTLFWLAGMKSEDLIAPSIKHVAEADAIAMALSVQKAYKIIKDKQNT